jgi:hypothetical protein
VPTHSRTDVPEQTHETMRAAAQRPVSGPAATDTLAAGGGLELPGREECTSEVPIVGIDHDNAHEPIPGEHDATTLTHRPAGAVGGAANGTPSVPTEVDALHDDTRRERVREGGGRDAERQFLKQQDGDR